MQTYQSLPHSLDSEKALLCSICLLPEVINELPAQMEGLWYIPAHRIIFAAIQTILSHNDPLDFISLKARLAAEKQLEEIGGLEYLSEIWGFVPTAANWRYYFEIIHDRYVRRFVITEFTAFLPSIYDETDDLKESIAEQTEKFITGMALAVVAPPKTFKEQVHQTLDWLNEQAQSTGITGIRFGIDGLDHSLRGLQFCELCGIGAKSSDGKSALMLNLACNAVAMQDIPTAIFSLEMPDIQQIIRILALESNIGISELRRGRLQNDQTPLLMKTVERIMPWKMHIEDTIRLTFDSFCSRCRALRVKYGVRLFGLDMISLLSVPKFERYDLALAQVAQGCKNLALELDATIVILTQLNEQMQTKNSKAIFEACDVFLRIVRPDEEDDTKKEVLVEKNRNGPRGVIVPVSFDGSHMRFTDRVIGEMPDYGEPLKSYKPYND